MTKSIGLQSSLNLLDESLIEAESTVSYESDGNLLIIGHSDVIEQAIEKLAEPLHPVILFTDQCRPKLSATLKKEEIPYLNHVSDISIQGFMGQFHITADYQFDDCLDIENSCNDNNQENSIQNEISKRHFLLFHDLSEVEFDLILDLQAIPSLQRILAPPGYFSAANNTEQFDQMLDSLSDWIGVFDKPKYYDYLPERCAHSANSIVGCKQCIDHCPTNAISSENEEITINPYLCQGCGDCATTCPSGAMVYRYPSVKKLHDHIRNALAAFYHAGGTKPVLLLYEQETTSEWLSQNNHLLPQQHITCAIESISAYGLDTWLAALAYGASSIILLTSDSDLDISMALLDQQIAVLDTILQGLGITDCPVKRCTPEILPTLTLSSLELNRHATFSGIEDKTRIIRLAVNFLQHNHTPKTMHQALPKNALFGEIIVDRDHCTLCMSCVSACPQGALLSSNGIPQLKFLEVNCVQCGICENTCPESAVSLNPRYVYDDESVRTPRLLHEDEVINCVQCGKPFIGAKMLSSMFEKMTDHPMYQGSQRSLLQMCGDCRVIALHSEQNKKH